MKSIAFITLSLSLVSSSYSKQQDSLMVNEEQLKKIP